MLNTIRFIFNLSYKEKDILPIYHLIDELALSEKFEEIDTILDFADPNSNIDYAIALLTTSGWVRKHLKNREKFYRKVSKRLDVRLFNIINYRMDLLEGLE
jgi:hypothetical protein